MTSLSQFTLVLFLSLFLISSLPPSQAFFSEVWIKRHVHIINDLPGDMMLHCKSGDDDLGARTLHQGEEQVITFKMNFFGSTLFFCSARREWRFRSFDVFTEERDKYRCRGDCKWSLRNDGIYFSNNGTAWDREYWWEYAMP
ncbi:hypothetical protein ACJRO7_010261 [Eucalyptus globulus]|uniref:S-protein homolog n=1 Tax=Eucalyptus globulus TaxID=34317 RepID=A0ABD3LBH7_EUCGL